MDPSVHYLNCAYMSPLSRQVEEAGIAAIHGKRSPSFITPDDFFDTPSRVKQVFAQLIDGDSRNVALFPSVSYGIATAARNLHLKPGQNIVMLHEQFPSNVYTWMRLAETYEADVRTVYRPKGASLADIHGAWNEAILAAIDSSTAVVAVPIVHWADGTLFDLEAIRARTNKVGAALIVDGTQSIGALPFSLSRVEPDALITAGYKWLFGPYSCAIGWMGPRFSSGIPIEENWINRKGSEDFAGLVDYESDYQPGAARFDVGEKSNFILMPMLLAALEQVSAWTPAAIQDYAAALMAPFEERILEAGYELAPTHTRGAHLFGIRLPGGQSVESVRTALSERRVSVSVRGTAIRIAPHVYNDESDVVALVDALEHAVRP
jgi:selenocysteine lyase/cysteine desulfurase